MGDLLERLYAMTKAYSVQDDALTTQRNTLEEYRYYLLEPLERACKRLTGDDEEAEVEDDDFDPARPCGIPKTTKKLPQAPWGATRAAKITATARNAAMRAPARYPS